MTGASPEVMETVQRLEGRAAAANPADWTLGFANGRWTLTDGSAVIDLPTPPPAFPGLQGMWVLADGMLRPAGVDDATYALSVSDFVQNQQLDAEVPQAPLPPGLSPAAGPAAGGGPAPAPAPPAGAGLCPCSTRGQAAFAVMCDCAGPIPLGDQQAPYVTMQDGQYVLYDPKTGQATPIRAAELLECVYVAAS